MKASSALTACRQILRKSGSSFDLAFRILPADQRDALTAFYAFCRQVDDAVDDAPDPQVARFEIAAWRKRLADLYALAPTNPASSFRRPTVPRFHHHWRKRVFHH